MKHKDYRDHPTPALYRKFGRWTFVAKWGVFALMIVALTIYKEYPSPLTFQVMVAGLAAFFGWGLYLCCLTAQYNAEEKERDKNGKII